MHDRVLGIAKTVLGELDVDRVLTASLDGLVELCGASRGMILLFDAEGEIVFEKARNLERRDVERPEFQVSRTVIDRVRSEGRSFFDDNLETHPITSASESIQRLGLLSVLALPMIHEGQVFGVVYLDSNSLRHRFTEEMAQAAETFCEFIAVAARHALDRHRLRDRVDSLEQELREKYRFDGIVGRDPKMVDVLKLVSRIADSEANVLVEGESGTGKELIARALHFNSRRRDRPFIPVNCGALPEALQEAELFGYERGAFTGAVKSSPGWFERADGGTIFLDEVGEMPLSLQVKLLRVLESGEYARLGSTTLRRSDARIVAATNQDLEEMVGSGRMRSDLLFRLCVVKVTLPPLRERASDLPLLIRHFLESKATGDRVPARLSRAAEAALLAYPFPGNVRELQNLLHRALLVSEGETLELEDFPSTVRGAAAVAPSPSLGSFREAKQRVIDDFERRYLSACLEQTAGHITRAAALADIDPKNFHTKMKKLGIDAARFKRR